MEKLSHVHRCCHVLVTVDHQTPVKGELMKENGIEPLYIVAAGECDWKEKKRTEQKSETERKRERESFKLGIIWRTLRLDREKTETQHMQATFSHQEILLSPRLIHEDAKTED
ncbi:hypothetical protein KOW79_005150 [Hemibagrus wyckioides]|uniref:Uncharacterized protein n=1 Tax=Hemibagrus wyckioides TaxID=337641 RepID=A0A9D3NXT3_9TELE|nr:hypothetical protein KOW79_005150 [Hemibagrus wyckioides]